VKAGCDLECGNQYYALTRAWAKHCSRGGHRSGAAPHFDARFRLGMFDPDGQVPYAQIPIAKSTLLSTPRRPAGRPRFSRAVEDTGVLPLDRAKVRHLAVIGANADSVPMLLGNYNGTPSRRDVLKGIRTAAEKPTWKSRISGAAPWS